MVKKHNSYRGREKRGHEEPTRVGMGPGFSGKLGLTVYCGIMVNTVESWDWINQFIGTQCCSFSRKGSLNISFNWCLLASITLQVWGWGFKGKTLYVRSHVVHTL